MYLQPDKVGDLTRGGGSDMKVKKYIEYLQTLDQDKDIYVVYDGFLVFDPVADEVADDDCTRKDGTFEYRKGDYLIKAG